MNDYLVKKLKEGRIQAGFKQAEVASKIGIKPNTLSNYENGVSEPDIDTFCALCDIYKLNPAEILNEAYGLSVQGSDFSIKPSEIEHIKKYRQLDPAGQETVSYILDRESSRVKALSDAVAEIASLKGRLETCSSLVSIEDMRPKYYITYYHKLASAGRGEYLFEDIPTDLIAVEDTPVARRADFVIGVIGDSMEPTYHDGDNVFVEKTDIVKIGEIGIFFIGNECFIKEAGADGLISHNSKYPLIPGSDSIRCVGRILGKAERLQHE